WVRNKERIFSWIYSIFPMKLSLKSSVTSIFSQDLRRWDAIRDWMHFFGREKADYMNILVGNGNITVSFDDIHCKNMRIGKETIDKFGILANSMTFDRVKAKFMDKHVFESGIIDGIGALRVSFDYNHKLSEDLLRKVMRNKEKLELPRKIPAANLRRIHDNFAEFSRLFG
ncbi:hypothetical protein PFISCL1PPCAC_28524, partial [Pristionchus fissidentatus]